MSWLTIIWSMCAAACWMVALVHLCIAALGRPRRANLLAALIAMGAGAVAMGELGIMQADDVETCRRILILQHLSLAAMLVPMPWFVLVHFGAGKRWLAWLGSLLWLLALVINFFQPNSLTYSEITGLVQRLTFWGESFTYIHGTRNPLSLIADLAVLLILAHIIDASIRLWRRGGRRRTLLMGGSMIFFFVAAMAHVPLVDLGVLKIPTLIGPIFLPIVAAMSLELVLDVVASSRLSRRVAANEARWSTLLDNIRLLVVGLDRDGRVNYVNRHLCEVTGYDSAELLRKLFDSLISPRDLSEARARFAGSIQGNVHEQTQFRLRARTGEDRAIRWSTVLQRDENDEVSGTISIGADITERLRAENTLRETKATLERAGSLNLLGELSAALAHELNQPLAAILSNAQAARRFMRVENPELGEVRAILDDIVDDDKRAGGVIQRLRALMRPGPVKIEKCDLHQIIRDTLDLCRADLVANGIDVVLDLAADYPVVDSGRVELQQVLMNLVTNALQAMDECPARTLDISTRNEDGWLLVRIRDTGTGIPDELLPGIFEPFSTTRSEGFGMGLAICRRLLEVHASKIEARNRSGAGAEFSVRIPTRDTRSE